MAIESSEQAAQLQSDNSLQFSDIGSDIVTFDSDVAGAAKGDVIEEEVELDINEDEIVDLSNERVVAGDMN